MICDKCHEETGGFQVKQKDGTVLCHSCAKAKTKKASSIAKTKDPFIKLCRNLSKMTRTPLSFADVFVETDEGRCYTNAHVMLTDIEENEMEVSAVDLKTLEERNEPYPNVGLALSKASSNGHVVEIPEEFYGYLRSVFETKKRGRTLVRLHEGGFRVYEKYEDHGATMDYREVVPPIGFAIVFDGAYLDMLRPSKIRLTDGMDPAVVESSYLKYVDERKHVLLMPVKED